MLPFERSLKTEGNHMTGLCRHRIGPAWVGCLLATVATALAAAGCSLELKAWTPDATEVIGTWTADACHAELVLAAGGTASASHLVFGWNEEVADGTGTWTMGDVSAGGSDPGELLITIGPSAVDLQLYRRNGQETLLDILGDPDEGRACNFVRSTRPAESSRAG
jgi:hypothetical protein